MNLLEVEDLHVRYGSFEAVRGVSLSLAKGEIADRPFAHGRGNDVLCQNLADAQLQLAVDAGLIPDDAAGQDGFQATPRDRQGIAVFHVRLRVDCLNDHHIPVGVAVNVIRSAQIVVLLQQ